MSAVEQYLDDLYLGLPREPRTARRILIETGDHLYDAVDDLVRQGMERHKAEDEAVRRFGPPDRLVAEARRQSLRALAADTVVTSTRIGGVGLLAVGLSGVIAAAMTALFGEPFVGGAIAGAQRATVAETAADAVWLRVLAGLAGAVLVAVSWAASRRRATRPRALPAAVPAAVTAAAFAGAVAVLAAAALDQGVQHGSHGVGYYLSGAIAAAVGLALAAPRAVRTMLAPQRQG